LEWANDIKTVEDEGVKQAIIAANNHYAGFGPETFNIFRNMLAKWEERRGRTTTTKTKIPLS
jgi:hypothetical protein